MHDRGQARSSQVERATAGPGREAGMRRRPLVQRLRGHISQRALRSEQPRREQVRPEVPVMPAGHDRERNELGVANGRMFVTRPERLNFPVNGSPNPRALPANPNAMHESLRQQCESVRQAQQDYADAMRHSRNGERDPQYWFARVYSHVTQGVLDTVARGRYEYPIAVLQETLSFHATYRNNLDAWQSKRLENVEPNWAAAFGTAERNANRRWYQTNSMQIMSQLMPAIQSHIRFDLPRALASVYERHYAGIPGVSKEDFHRDFEAMMPVFDYSMNQMRAEINEACRGVDPGRSKFLFGVMTKFGMPRLFNLTRERRHAQGKSEVIIDAHERGIQGQPAVQREIEGYMRDNERLPWRRSAGTMIQVPYVGTKAHIDTYNWEAQPE